MTAADRKLAKAAKTAHDAWAAIGAAMTANPDLYDALEVEYNEAAKTADALQALLTAQTGA